jgi:hypothetical protein
MAHLSIRTKATRWRALGHDPDQLSPTRRLGHWRRIGKLRQGPLRLHQQNGISRDAICSNARSTSNPAAANLHIRPLDSRPCNAMRRFFLARITSMGCEGVIEGFTVDILGAAEGAPAPSSADLRCFGRARLPPSTALKGRSRPCIEGGSSAGGLLSQYEKTSDRPQALLMAIFFSLFCASADLGNMTVSTPFLKLAVILSASTPSGTPNERWNEP